MSDFFAAYPTIRTERCPYSIETWSGWKRKSYPGGGSSGTWVLCRGTEKEATSRENNCGFRS